MNQIKEYIKYEIDIIYSNLKGGYFVEIYDDVDSDSPLKHLEFSYWNGVCISNKKMYTENRNCYIEPFQFDYSRLNDLDVYGDNLIFQKIKKYDKSNLIHVAYIDCDRSIEICKSFLNGCYEKCFEKEPNAGHWATQVILLIVNLNKNDSSELIQLCNKYFLKLYKSQDNLLLFKHEVLV
jgi:hypothetical protein